MALSVYKVLFVCMAVHLSCGSLDPTLYIDIPSSRFLEGELVHGFGVGAGASYSIVTTENCPNATFAIDSTGELTVARTIDFSTETPMPRCARAAVGAQLSLRTFNCFITVDDSGQSYGISTVINVISELQTADLMFPEQFYSGEVVEGVTNTSVAGVSGIQAQTLPVGGLLQPEYRIVGDASESFTVAQQRTNCEVFPVILTSTSLNREARDYYELTLEAFAVSGTVTARTIIGVQVLDENDHAPLVTDGPPSADVDESTLPGSEVARFQAVDPDSGLNREIYFSLQAPSPHFTVNPYTGSLYLFSKADYETASREDLSVMVSDLGLPQLLSQATNITVFIADVNEQPPDIHALGQSPPSVSELAEMGIVVATVNVTDQDSSEVFLNISSANCDDCFRISNRGPGSSLFDVTVNGLLDFEMFPEGYTVSLTAFDNGEPRLTAARDLSVSVIDENEPPAFPQAEYEVSVLEGAPLGTEIVRLQATDPDTGTNSQITYSVMSTDDFASLFAIDGATGTLFTAAEIDYEETTTSVQLSVSARDNPGETASATVTVNILDANDNQPSFPSTEDSITVPESNNAMESVYDFSATDEDSDCNGGVSYSILFAEPEAFRIDSLSGLLYPLNDSSLDFEVFQSARVVVRAADLGEGSNALEATTLRITLTDIDDTLPVVEPIDCPCWITEGTAGERCQPLSAYDPDSADLVFLIKSGNEQGRFTIDSSTGEVFPVNMLDREEQNRYTLQIAASTSDLSQESESESLEVIVVDVNDSPPTYPPSISRLVPEDIGVGDLVANVAAEHLDVGFNGLTMYTFDANPARFRIDPLSGNIYTTQSLQDLEVTTFMIEATDLLIPSQQDTTQVTLTISGSTNNPPVFQVAFDRITVPENLPLMCATPTDCAVAQITAADNDEGSNGMLTYEIVSSTTELFVLGQTTGLLTLSQSLSGTADSVYSLNVSATDGGSEPLVAFQVLEITIYRTSIVVGGAITLVHNAGVGVCRLEGNVVENSGGGVSVTVLPFSQGGRPIMYTIIDDTPDSAAFSINDDTVQVVTESGFGSVFDRTQREAIYLTLRAVYEGNFHLCSLTVLIEDINDHAPVFGQSSYSIEIYDVTPAGASVFQLEAVDLDVGSNANTEYSLTPTGAPFSLSSSGVLKVSGSLQAPGYDLTVRAEDGLDPTKSDSAAVNVVILATSNNPPTISDPESDPILLQESDEVGSVISSFSVSDLTDTGIQGRNSFCIHSGNNFGLFTISTLGSLIVARALDFELHPSSFALTVAAFDSSPNPRFQTRQLGVILLDENEAPLFRTSAYVGAVVENLPVDTEVVTVEAVDRDAGAAGMVSYSVQGTDQFDVDPSSGLITTAALLNREAASSHTFSVIATDQAPGGQQKSSSVEVSITVLDDNDDVPTFTVAGGQQLSIREDAVVGSVLVELADTVSDNDVGRNGQLKFSIVSGNEDFAFSLDPWTGVVSLGRELDYETDPLTYDLSFGVADLGDPPLTSSVTLSVSFALTDVNDNFPVFSQPVYDCTVTENAMEFEPPCQVSAVDGDLVANIVEYSIVGISSFTINPSTGVLQIRESASIDREAVPFYVLRVQAEDSSTSRLSSSALVLVRVLDENEVPLFDPIPNPSTSIVRVPESLPVNTFLFHALARDSDEGMNGMLEYVVLSPDLFRADSQTGAVFLEGTLDYESAQSHDLLIQASNPSGTSILHPYTLEVIDINENTLPPFFPPETPSAVSVLRSAPPGTPVTTITATDGDPGPDGILQYFATGGTGHGYFEVDPATGDVSIAYNLTGVEGDRLSLEVMAIDTGRFPLSSTHTLLVLLEEDPNVKPFFARGEFRAAALEGFGNEGEIFTFVQALVNGYPDPSACYSILAGNEENKFSINASSGAIAIASTLDRELVAYYNLTVQASRPDLEYTSVALLTIEVENEDDFRPSFPVSFDTTIFDNFPIDPGQSFLRVFAIDLDFDPQLTYSLDTNESLPFGISETTGELYLTEPLGDASPANYAVSVTATDQAGFSKSASFTIMVASPVDPNDDTPIFSSGTTTVSITEDTPPGTIVFSAVAQDNDSPVLLYSFTDPSNIFAILPNSGDVYTTAPLDRESDPQHVLQIQVWDGTATAIFVLQILLTDINDNVPSFTQAEFSFSATEHSTPGTVVGSVTAIDDDLNSSNQFSIVDSQCPCSLELFEMSADGILRVVGDLDRERLPTHVLTVEVSDGGTPLLINYTRITVAVVDSNDHAPEFQFPEFRIFVPENATIGSTIFSVSAFDPDTGSNAAISYSLLTLSTPFEVNSSTGDLTITSSLDAETRSQYILSITAFHSETPSQISALSLTVNITDVLDSSPVLQAPTSVFIAENLPPYSTVAVIAGSNARPVHYSIVGGNEQGHFLVEPLSGVLRTTVPLDREALASYTLTIQGAFAAGFEEQVTILISVSDENDNNPVIFSPRFTHDVPENSDVLSTVFTLEISDPDDGSNGTIGSVFIPDNLARGYFTIEPSGSVVLTQQLDREGAFPSITFDFFVLDSGSPQRFAVGRVSVVVQDSNDNPPVFSEADYRFTLSVPVLVNTPLFSVVATDRDEGEFARIRYSITGRNDSANFAINSISGDITVTNNYQLQSLYALTITATDGGGLTAEVAVSIAVKECGFRDLLFHPRSATVDDIEESALAGRVVFEPNVLNLDSEATNTNSELEFYFSVPDPSFIVNMETGTVTLLESLDRESKPVHRLVVQARVTSDPDRIAQAEIEILVADINDNAPEFINTPYSAFVTDNVATGHEVLRVMATDPDEGSNAEVTYHLLSDPSDSFEIDLDSGQLTVASNLGNTGLGLTIVLLVEARDRGEPSLSAQTNVSVVIVDSSAPQFSMQVYRSNVSESAQDGTSVVTVSASANSGDADINYSFDSEDPTLPFFIDFFTGEVTVNGRGLNFELNQFYQLDLLAVDTTTALSGRARLEVQVLDVNDVPPAFEQALYQEVVPENVESGTPILEVSAVDGDSMPNAQVSYELGESDTPDAFFINSLTGAITTAGSIDFEQNAVFEFTILALDSGSPQLTGTTTVRIAVENLNDNPPTFTQSTYQASVSEVAIPGTSVRFVVATDEDMDPITYDIVEGIGSENFEINSDGLITLNSVSIDIAEVQYELNVSASDGVFTRHATVIIEVEDQNDNSPVFTQDVYTASVTENPQPGVFITQVNATDEDRGSNAEVTYSSSLEAFVIDPQSGVISTVGGMIDREQSPSLNLIVIARDGGGRTGSAVVEITVLDVNDNPPVFSQQEYIDNVIENTVINNPVITVVAEDDDAGINGTVTYTIDNVDPQFPFMIDSGGVIRVALPLDHETNPQFTFTVEAVDMGNPPMTSEAASVTINILDVADSPPQFVDSPYNISFPEGRTGELLTIIPSEDSVQDCITVLYEILSGDPNSPFTIGDFTGVITLSRTLDRETEDLYFFTVQATCILLDTNTQGFAFVTVHVQDINEPPRFASVVFQGMVAENSNQFTAVFTDSDTPVLSRIQAVDDDLGSNGTVLLQLSELDGAPFRIIPDEGTILTDGGIDREMTSSYTFIVQAHDLGNPSLTSDNFVRVIIRVTDQNDSPPEFNQSSYRVEIPEDTSPQVVIFSASGFVSDNDTEQNAQIAYSFGAATDEFSIDSSLGEVMTTLSLDRETQASFVLDIIASDGVNSGMAQLIVNLTDVNDSPPRFNETQYMITVPENSPVGVPLLQVFTTDSDEGVNMVAEYSILDAPNRDTIAINETTGEISFASPPDFEAAERMEFQVRAADIGGLRDFVPLVIILLDENDNHPVFSEDSYEGEVRENLIAGTNILRIIASDIDSGNNSIITYSLNDSASGYFTINPVTGVVATTTSFDRETNSTFEIVVTATDHGVPSLSNSTTVRVTVIDRNDQRPVFPENTYRLNISELEDPGLDILTVAAEDGDEGTNADVLYRLAGDNSNDFRLEENPGTGSVTVVLDRSLNHESVPSYTLTLRAIDGGFPALEGNTTLLITVIDENEFPPMFTSPEYSESVAESEPIGTTILTVEATDLDASDEVIYSIRDRETFPELAIGASTGDITIAQSLDFESRQGEGYTLTVEASDQVHDLTLVTVVITIIDVNDNAPRFVNPNNEMFIFENQLPRMLDTLVAEDDDALSPPEAITYAIESGNTNEAFQIAADSGELSVIQTLDREMVAEYVLVVTANDNGDPPLTGSTVITVTVGDENDNPPVASDQTIYVHLFEGLTAAVNQNLGRVFVEDPDINNDLSFVIMPLSSDTSAFRIGSDGMIDLITQTPPLGTFSYSIRITDADYPAVNTEVEIRVMDVTQLALRNSFNMQLSGIMPDRFVTEKLQPFVSAVTDVLVENGIPSTVEVLVFGIQEFQEDDDFLDLFISVQSSDGGFVPPNLVQHLIHANRAEFETGLGLSIRTEHVDTCASEPCSEGQTCSTPRTFTPTTEILGSNSFSVIHLGLAEEHSTVCSAPVSACAQLSCPEPSYCVEERGVATCFDDCSLSPCQNEGTCIPQLPGYYCSCRGGFDGRNCEQTTATFTGASYAIFPAVNRRPNGSISLEVTTNQNNGLLFYTSRFDDEARDFLGLEIADGFASVVVSYGDDFMRLSLRDVRVNDQLWHTVVVQYNSTTVTLTVKTFDPYTRDESAAIISGPYRSLDLGAPLILGSLPEEFGYNVQSDLISFIPFTGCLRNFRVNEILLDFSSPLAEVDVARGCGFANAACDPNPCQNGGLCIGEWDSFFCDCPVEFAGPVCQQGAESASFFGNGFIRYRLETATSQDRPVRQTNESTVYRTGRNSIALSFQTSVSSGTLLQLGDPEGSLEYAVLEIVEGHLQFRYNLGSGEATARSETVAVDDTVFREVSVQRIEESVEVVIDDRYVARATSSGGETTLDIPSDAIYLGATVGADGEASQGFTGCLWSVKLDRKDLPVAEENEDFIPLFRSQEIDVTCPGLGPLSESEPVPLAYVYGGLVGILAVLFLIVLVIVGCILRRQYKEKHKFHIDNGSGVAGEEEGRGSPTAFAWRPAKTEDYRARNFSDSVSSGEFPGGNTNMNNLNGRPVFLQPPSTSSLDTTPVVSETTFTDPETKLLPQRGHQHANPLRREQRQQAVQAPGDRIQASEMHVTNPGFMEDSPDSGAPRQAYRHRRPSSPPPIDLPHEEPTQVQRQQHRQPPQPAPQPAVKPPQTATKPQLAAKPPVAAKPPQANPRHQVHRIQSPASPIPVPSSEPGQQQGPSPARSPLQSPVEETTQPLHQRSLSSPDSANPRQAAPFHPRHPTFSPTPSDDREEEENTAQVLHVRSPSAASGHQSLGGKSDTSLQDDIEVGKYIRKRIEEADFQVEEYNLDEMRPYKIEGEYEPLGSVGSLYDIIREADKSTLGESFSLSPDPTPVHSRDPSKSSMGSSYMGDYGKKLDHLMERFHNLTASLSPEEYDEGRMV